MKKLLFTTFIAFLFSALSLQAQNLYFCSDITSTGEPIGIASSWTITSGGGFVQLLFNNGGKPIKSGILAVKIDKEDGKNYTKFDSKVMDVEANQTYTSYNYNFKEAGNYRVTILDNNKLELAKGYVTISLKGGGSTNYGSVSYNAKMTFTTDVVDGEPADDYTTFNIASTGGYIYVYVMNDKRLGITSTTLKVKRKSGSYYSEEVASEDYTVNPDKAGTFMKYTFYSAGDYKVEFLDKENNTTIATGYVTINVKGGSRYNAKMTFTTDVVDGEPADDYSTFNISKDGGFIYVYVMNDKKLNTTSTTLKVYKKNYSGSYTEEITSDAYTINADKAGTFMKYTFYKPGDYKVVLNDGDENQIASGYVTINRK
ncbi:MAG: hypothetical protein EOP53_17840 [Sphingobacteriales bacterium]|nr:MAG: hypothetical protein EOP53_17840 [Sphingobacteriales bacterium]